MRGDTYRRDAAARRLAERQFGVINSAQARSVGLTDGQVDQRVRSGAWRRWHPGVFHIAGAEESARARLVAGCIAAGPLAVASHLSAAWVLGLLSRPPALHAVTVPYNRRPRLAGIEVHRSRDLDPRRTRVSKAVPHTDAARTLSDLAAELSGDRMSLLVDRALSRGLVSSAELTCEVQRRSERGRKGPASLEALLLARGFTGGPEPSVLEAETLRLFEKSGIPVIEREVLTGPRGRYRIDFLLVPGLAVEVDGFAHHWSPEAKAYDEARRNQLRLGGPVRSGLHLAGHPLRPFEGDRRSSSRSGGHPSSPLTTPPLAPVGAGARASAPGRSAR